MTGSAKGFMGPKRDQTVVGDAWFIGEGRWVVSTSGTFSMLPDDNLEY